MKKENIVGVFTGNVVRANDSTYFNRLSDRTVLPLQQRVAIYTDLDREKCTLTYVTLHKLRKEPFYIEL